VNDVLCHTRVVIRFVSIEEAFDEPLADLAWSRWVGPLLVVTDRPLKWATVSATAAAAEKSQRVHPRRLHDARRRAER
jgi:hypothetical protein